MKTCPKCGAQIADDANFCKECGTNLAEAAPQATPAPELSFNQEVPMPEPQPAPVPPYQQPNQFVPAEYYPVPENPCDKILGIVAVWFSFVGVILAYFGGDVNGQRSDYLKFYANEGLVLSLFSLFCVIPVLGLFWGVFMLVCQIMAIINACKGEAKPVLFFGTIQIIK